MHKLVEANRAGINLIGLLSIAVLCIGILRVLSLTTHTPLLGYANNFDMIRMQSCIQLWPASDDSIAGDLTPSAPLSDYKFLADEDEALFNGLCVPSSELIWLSLIRNVYKLIGIETVSMYVFGLFKASMIILTASAFQAYLIYKKEAAASLANALIFSLILADPANTLYINTFYTEFSALLFLYISFAFFWITLSDPKQKLPRYLTAAAIIILGLSRYQHAGLPAVFMICALWSWKRDSFRITMLLFGFATIVTLSYYRLAPQFSREPVSYNYYISFANATDTYLGAVLPNARDTHEAARTLGLPNHCVDHIGKTWYTPGIQENHPCPEVLDVNRIRILALIIRDPYFLINITDEALPLLRPWVLTHIGSVEGQDFELATQFSPSLSQVIDKLPLKILKGLFLLPILVLIVLFVARKFISHRTRQNDFHTFTTFLICMVTVSYTVFYSSLFGDGYYEFSKHTHLYFSILGSIMIILIMVISQRIITSVYNRTKHTANDC